MNMYRYLVALTAGLMLAACGGGSSGSSGSFGLIEFLESGQNNIPRNRQVRFRFSSPVAAGQDLFTRLKIQNVEQTTGGSNFARAQGFYLINADQVIFTPRLPNKPDRSDAGFKSDGSYHVFLSGGPDGLESEGGEKIPTQQEFLFETNEFFEDVVPSDPPRAFQLVAVDSTTGVESDISRLDPRPGFQAGLDNAALVAATNIIDPGAGGAPYATPWRFELKISESIDPSTVNISSVQLTEIRENAFTTAPDQSPTGHQGDIVNFPVSASVEVVQSVDTAGNYDIRIRVTPLQTLVDNTRYRIQFSGQILGIDFRKEFSGDNGLTGDGEMLVGGSPFAEDGGLGYTSEFLVYDRGGINASRTLLYDPLIDGINAENGQTANTEEDLNSALYNPAANPGTAVGFLSAFGNGTDGTLAASGGNTTVIDTGDTPNEVLEQPFTVTDLNPDDDYLADTRPGGQLEYDSVEPFEMQLEALTVSSSSTLRVIGVNPVLFRVAGIVQISGTIDVAGADGKNGGGSFASGGEAGAGGFAGADSKQGDAGSCQFRSGSCTNFSSYLNGCSKAKNLFPASVNGNGPGRGLAGGEGYTYYAVDNKNTYSGSGGGGASHALVGGTGEDRRNNSGSPGTSGPSCSAFANVRISGVIGVRGQPGPMYGDREVIDVNMGGSGGAAGGANHTYQFGTNQQAGGAGGGGGGSLMIVASGTIFATGGIIDVSGGNGGKGGIKTSNASQGWDSVTGGGGGGSGGTLALISGDTLELAGAAITAVGGTGGPRANDGTTTGCNACNAGGDGGDGFIFLMDADGELDGFLPSAEGEYDNDPRGVLTISAFNADRFSSITAITELFPMTAAKPRYLDYDPLTDILGNVSNATQKIIVRVSSSRSNPEDPQVADPGSEIGDFPIAQLVFQAGSTKVEELESITQLNLSPGTADRQAFVRVRAAFDYGVGVEAALGPFAFIDEVKISYSFNG
jgi:hypothetical protein